jgi:hypothetical protein
MVDNPNWRYVQMDQPTRGTHLCLILQFDNDDTPVGKGTLTEIEAGENCSGEEMKTDYDVKSKDSRTSLALCLSVCLSVCLSLSLFVAIGSYICVLILAEGKECSDSNSEADSNSALTSGAAAGISVTAIACVCALVIVVYIKGYRKESLSILFSRKGKRIDSKRVTDAVEFTENPISLAERGRKYSSDHNVFVM